MGTVMKQGRLLLAIKSCSFTLLVRNISSRYSFLLPREMKEPRNLTEIPEMPKLWAKYKLMKLIENNDKKCQLDELIRESLANKTTESMHHFEKIVILQSDIGSLINQNLVQSVDSVVSKMLGNLDRFPFDSSTIGQDENNLSILLIRNEIEKQYLGWKFRVSWSDIGDILSRYGSCLYEFRSLGTMRRNVRLLNRHSRHSDLCVAEKIYHINQKPFQVNSITDFQDTIAGLNWQLFPQFCPRILRHSHQHILFLISLLRELKFTEQQIHEGLPFLHLRFEYLIKRLDKMLSNPEMGKFRNENKFLYLLSFHASVLQDLISFRGTTFEELIDMVTISKNLTGRVKLLNFKDVFYHVRQVYEIDSSFADFVKRHPKYTLVSEKQVRDTVLFLKSKNFTADEVAESLTITLYPRRSIEKVLEEIDSKAETLEKHGFKECHVPEETDNFAHGTKLKSKLLQLCLYYMEKPYHFSGNGVWDLEDTQENITVPASN